MTQVRTLVVASNNKHKIAEISEILGKSWSVLSAQDVAVGVSWDETGTTFVENARIKAKALKARTSHCVLADDSGLCVDALNGAPGVWSSSYGGVEGDHGKNNERLLRDMKAIPEDKRGAYFICVLVFLDESGREFLFDGRCHGRIALNPAGSAGFGYDPLFVPDGAGKAMALLSESEKNKISHRGLAMQKFLASFS